MTGLLALWLPILVSAVLVFVVSSVIHMASPWHKSDYPKLSSEDRVMDALRPLAIPPGDYMMPRPSSRAEMRTPQFIEKFKQGPVLMLTVWPGGSMSMGKQLVQWFVYALVVGCFAAYRAGRALPVQGQAAPPGVRLRPGGRVLRRLRRGARAPARRSVPERVPLRRRHRVRRLLARAPAAGDLVPPRPAP